MSGSVRACVMYVVVIWARVSRGGSRPANFGRSPATAKHNAGHGFLVSGARLRGKPTSTRALQDVAPQGRRLALAARCHKPVVFARRQRWDRLLLVLQPGAVGSLERRGRTPIARIRDDACGSAACGRLPCHPHPRRWANGRWPAAARACPAGAGGAPVRDVARPEAVRDHNSMGHAPQAVPAGRQRL